MGNIKKCLNLLLELWVQRTLQPLTSGTSGPSAQVKKCTREPSLLILKLTKTQMASRCHREEKAGRAMTVRLTGRICGLNFSSLLDKLQMRLPCLMRTSSPGESTLDPCTPRLRKNGTVSSFTFRSLTKRIQQLPLLISQTPGPTLVCYQCSIHLGKASVNLKMIIYTGNLMT